MNQVVRLPAFDWFSWDCIGVTVAEDEDTAVAFDALPWKHARQISADESFEFFQFKCIGCGLVASVNPRLGRIQWFILGEHWIRCLQQAIAPSLALARAISPSPDCPQLQLNAIKIPTIQSPLFSIGQACDDNCIAVFTNKEVTISKANDISISCNKEPLIKGHQADNKLWCIPVPKQPTHLANSAHTQTNAKKLATFLHAAAGYPPLSTFCKAIDAGWFITWPGLSSPLIRKHLEQSVPTLMGRIKRVRQGLRSTRAPPAPLFTQDEPLDPPRSRINRQHQVTANAFKLEELQGLILSLIHI